MYAAHEKQKMTKYNHRVIQIEKSTFAPLCFSTTGGMGPQAMMFVKKLAKHMTRTNGQSLSNTMASFRRRLHFEPLKATLINIKAASDGYIYYYYIIKIAKTLSKALKTVQKCSEVQV